MLRPLKSAIVVNCICDFVSALLRCRALRSASYTFAVKLSSGVSAIKLTFPKIAAFISF